MELPTWDNTKEYSDISCLKLTQDFEILSAIAKELHSLSLNLNQIIPNIQSLKPDELHTALKTAWEMVRASHEASLLRSQLFTYIDSTIALNSKEKAAHSLMAKLREFGTTCQNAHNSLYSFVLRISETDFERFLNNPLANEASFYWKRERKNANKLLSLEEEGLLTELEQHGYQAWSDLYQNLTANLKCELLYTDHKEVISFAKALSNLEAEDRELRAASWHAMQETFKNHQESCAQVLNARAGWNIQIMKRRARGKTMDYLEPSLHKNRMSRPTLDALNECLLRNRDTGQLAIKTFARAWKSESVEPFNLKAPAPALMGQKIEPLPFDKAMVMIEDAYKKVHPDMGNFVPMMLKNGYIDALPRPNRRASAYCTGFMKSRTPRVFLNYSDSMMAARVVAHELGHAFHNWVMRDIHPSQINYPMTLAETASIFGEILFSHVSREKNQDPVSQYPTLWMEAEMAVVYLTNIPMRFCFEKMLMDKKLNGENLFAEDLCQMMEQAWKDWHGETTARTDPYFWAHKLHFHHYPFYNFPYSFGYLFGYAVFAKWLEMGDDFYPRYCALLRDTGRMEVEELIKTHLDEDCTQISFWQKGVDQVKLKISALDSTLSEIGFA
ncbi:MAG: hypothetical protein H3C47_07070 [Candidatus Cloacimonetes bacterium]|nr:hypothetical protein [Candidatus Cloacimonadota bacterium]